MVIPDSPQARCRTAFLILTYQYPHASYPQVACVYFSFPQSREYQRFYTKDVMTLVTPLTFDLRYNGNFFIYGSQ
ncbi:hypothetical protein EUGRSUZ_E01627 [Eucalyptus grandis]|uniref:Uncharacterized protein n=2 Tax=Eucalyptus grandis TaxID=71139 RepID=A0ACC3KUI3_EUCGR|nr:hypothetical protein EUGRSUZ_E01627 [Eucalyptus grandis]